MMCRSSYVLVFVCLVWSSLPHVSNGADGVTSEDSRVGGRQLLQNSQLPCPENYNFYNYTPILKACPSTNNISVVINQKKCCQSLCIVLGANGSIINDQNYDCSSQFFAYLTLAGNYSDGYFATVCTDPNSPEGIYCAPVADAPAVKNGGAWSLSQGTNSVVWSFLVALSVFELLVLVA